MPPTTEHLSNLNLTKVKRGEIAYELNQNGKIVGHVFRESGVLTSVADIQRGDEVQKGELLMTVQESKFSQNIDLSRLAYVPGYDDVKFEIYADEIQKGNVTVDVIEVRNPKPFDVTRTEDAEYASRRPLRFGSRTNVTTSGNWE